MCSFDIKSYWHNETTGHEQAFAKTRLHLESAFTDVLESCARCILSGGKILFIGNGGSAADAQHLATELTVRYIKDRKTIPAIALTTDTSTLTAAGNDLGFDSIFSRQLEALGNKGDVLIALSTSGNSHNIIKALEVAKAKGLISIGFTGRDGGKMKALCDLCLIVPDESTARIQEMHILLGHMLCGALEQKLGLTSENP